MEPFVPSFLSFSLAAGFSCEKPGQVFSGEVALGRIGAWRGVDRFCLEKFELEGSASGSIVSVFCIYIHQYLHSKQWSRYFTVNQCRSVDGS